jgi:hypothetical protein
MKGVSYTKLARATVEYNQDLTESMTLGNIHQPLLVKFASKDASDIEKKYWTLPLHFLHNTILIEKIAKCRIVIQKNLNHLIYKKTNQKKINSQLL